MHRRVAILIDGGFFRNRYREIYGKFPVDPKELAKKLYGMAMAHAGSMALRFGHLRDFGEWRIRSRFTKDIISGKLDPTSLKEDDVVYEMKQKGVDMKIGIDIATLALKQLVGKIILIAGDSDFVPASKLARREGIDFVLDPMWSNINPDLHEHIDGLESKCPKPRRKNAVEEAIS